MRKFLLCYLVALLSFSNNCLAGYGDKKCFGEAKIDFCGENPNYDSDLFTHYQKVKHNLSQVKNIPDSHKKILLPLIFKTYRDITKVSCSDGKGDVPLALYPKEFFIDSNIQCTKNEITSDEFVKNIASLNEDEEKIKQLMYKIRISLSGSDKLDDIIANEYKDILESYKLCFFGEIQEILKKSAEESKYRHSPTFICNIFKDIYNSYSLDEDELKYVESKKISLKKEIGDEAEDAEEIHNFISALKLFKLRGKDGLFYKLYCDGDDDYTATSKLCSVKIGSSFAKLKADKRDKVCNSIYKLPKFEFYNMHGLAALKSEIDIRLTYCKSLNDEIIGMYGNQSKYAKKIPTWKEISKYYGVDLN